MIHAGLVLLSLLMLAPWLSYLPLSAMASLLLLVAWNMSEAHKVVYLLRHAPRDDILVLVLCMALTVLFDMVIAITVGIIAGVVAVYGQCGSHDTAERTAGHHRESAAGAAH